MKSGADKVEGEATDVAAPKPKKGKKGKAAKKAGPKLIANTLTPAPVGHNSGEAIPGVKEIIDNIIASKARQKNEAKLQRDERNRAKTEFGILAGVLAHEIRLRGLDSDVRIQFESGHADLKVMSGYQFALDLKKDTVARTEDELANPALPKDDIINRQG